MAVVLHLEEVEGISVVRIEEKFIDAMNAPQLKVDLSALLKPKMHLIIDLSHVEFLDSSGMGVLLAIMRQVVSMGGTMKIAGVSKPVKTLLELVRFNKILDIFDTVESAVEALSAGKEGG